MVTEINAPPMELGMELINIPLTEQEIIKKIIDDTNDELLTTGVFVDLTLGPIIQTLVKHIVININKG